MAEFIFREATEEEEDNAIAANFHKYSALEVQDDKGLNVKPLSKIDTMLYDLQYWGETHGVKPLGDLATGIKAIKDTEYKRLVPEFTKSVTRAANTLLVKNVAGGGMSVVGRMLYDDNGNEDNARVKVNHAIFGTIRDFGDSIKKTSEEWNNSNLLKPDEKYFVGTFEQNPNLIRALDLAASGSSSLVAAYALAPVVGPEMAILAMSGADCMDVFDESLAAGNGKLKSLGLFSLATVGTAAMEKLPVEKAFGVKFTKKGLEKVIDSTKKTSVKITEAMLAEGGTEGLQTVYQNTIAKVGYDDARDIFEGAVEAIIGGALGGGMVSGVNFGYESFVNRAKKAGLNDQDIDNVINATAQTMADKPELIDVPFQENMKKTYQSFEKMIADLGDTPEAQRLIAKKQALDNVYNQYFETFKQKMPENQAKANAQLVRSSALYFADLDGISVDEWLKTKAPQIKWIGDIENQERTFERSVTPTKLTLDEKEINLFEALKNPELVKQYRKKDRRKSLLQFIRKRGGVKDVGGDLKAMDLHKKWGIVNNKNGESLDDMALAAWEHGYFVGEERPTINDLLEAIRDESFGNKHYAEEKELGIDDYVAQLAEEMDRLGIDYSNMSAREAEQAYNDAVAKYSNQNYVPEEQNTDEDIDALFDLSEPFFQIADENARLDEQYPAYEGDTININGQEKTVYNSNGDRIAKSKEALENFYKWFGDSKVVDKQGRPLVVYHGTRQRGITEFKTPYADKLIFFAYKKEFADDWAKNAPLTKEQTQLYRDMPYFSIEVSKKYREKYGENWAENESLMQEARAERENLEKEYLRNAGIEEITMPVYLKAENTFKPAEHWDLVIDEIEKYYGKDYRDENADAQTKEYLKQIKDGKWIFFEHENVIKKIRELGFDSIELEEISGQGITTIAVFEGNNQIKSTSNRGTYSESENIYYQFAGEKAQTAALDELDKAKQLEADGVDNEEIRQQTGWFKGADGKWRFEISDKDADFNEGYNIDKWKENGTYFEGLNFKLGKILKHDKLFSAYPELKDVNIEFENRRTDDGTLGSFVKAENKIYLSNQLNSKKALSVIMHELQHVIQHKEGFASGGNLETKDVLEEKYKEIIEKYDYSPEMQALERDLDRYEFLYDIVNTLEVAENPQKIINKNWYKEKVFGTPKGKYRKSFIEEKAQQFIDEIKEKYLSKSSWYYSQYLEYVQDGKLKEIKKEMNALGKSTWRRMKKKKPSEYTDAKSFLWELENSGGYDIYRRLAGEIEARNTQARMELTEEERRAKTPESTQDVANADAIVVFDDGTAMAYKPETYYQSAFHGTQHPELEGGHFSLEKVGSGEGGAAHGYGAVYAALKYDVAEGYRKRLVRRERESVFPDSPEELAITTYLKNNQNKDAAIKELQQIEKAEYKKFGTKDENVLAYTNASQAQDYLRYVEESNLEKQIAEVENSKGQTYEVDIPENPYLMDEQKTLGEQSPVVKKVLKQVANEIGVKWDSRYDNGKYIYDNIANVLGSKKAASQMLEKHGIKGITYFGQQDGRCFVIFNPADVKVIQKFYQRGKADSYLGAYTNRIIYLNQNANESTLPHELAHFWSDMLRQSKSLKAKEILKQVDKWAEKEFERKYSIAKQGDVYVVTDKSGKTVYDLMGEGFKNEENAKAYAKEELFARGFEKYLREGGKAPSRTLKSAFNNFYNWLKKIYVDLANLDIKLSPAMRNLYGELLGGTNIDTFLSEDLDGFIEQRQIADEDREKQTREIIQQAQQNKPKTFKEKVQQAYEAFDFGETWKEWAIPLSTRAKRISLSLRNKIRRYEYDTISTREKYLREVEPMLKKWKEFSDEDKVAFDLALKNNAPAIRDEILQKYNAVQDFNKVRDVLEQIYEQATNAGLDVGYIEDYFPRKVKDTQGLLSYLHGTDEWTGYQEALHREDPNNQFTAEEKADFLDKYLRGIVKADLAGYKYSSEKQRKLDVIDNTINQYYADSMQALINYIEGMNARIQVANFFGRNKENVEESIGEFVAYMENNGEIKPEQVDEVKAILKGVFNRKGANAKWIKTLRDIGYIYTMGGINTAITQIDDIFVAAYKGGILNTIQSLTQKNRITKKDLGIESIAAEFLEGTGTSKAVNWVFKKNGIDFIDSMGKNILLNSVLKKMEKMSDTELREYIEPIMEDETEQTIQDIRNGNISDNVRFFLFNELSDMQPVSLSELPELYNTGRKARIFYMLKSFMLKRIDTIRNECYDNIRSKDKDRQIKGWQNLYKLTLLMMLGGATKDLLIDLIYGRVIDLSDMLVNNLLGMVGLSKYNIYQVREEGLGHSLALFVMPPLLQVAEDLSGDVDRYIKGKRELKDFEVLKGLPIIGRFYYWLFGGGKEKTEKKMKGGKKFRV